MQRLFIHCGLHKTGTTAVQMAFASRRATRPSKGDIFYPQAGCPPGEFGHHNIAWQIAADWRFNPHGGTLDTLKAEIGHADGDVLISSEDFESILCREDLIRSISDFAKEVHRRPIFVVYLRNQLAYVHSLYLTLVKHGYNEEFLSFAERAAAQGSVALCDWVFHFDYARAVNSLSRCANGMVIVRSYDSLRNTSAANDMAQVLELDAAAIQNRVSDNRSAARPAFAESLKSFCTNVLRRPTNLFEEVVIEALVASAKDLRLATGIDILAKFTAAFRWTNSILCGDLGIAPDLLEFTIPRYVARPLLMEQVFSKRTVSMIMAMASSRATELALPAEFDAGPAGWWKEQSIASERKQPLREYTTSTQSPDAL